MNRDACRCGRMPYARCTRCGNAACNIHYSTDNSSRGMTGAYGVGISLANAAYWRGYWSQSDRQYVCPECRAADGNAHSARALRQSRGWHRDPFLFAITAASQGYVITEPGINRADAIRSWRGLGLPPETVTLAPRYSGRRGRHQDPRMVGDHPGWAIPRTVPYSGVSQYDDSSYTGWGGATLILVDGRALPEEHEFAKYSHTATRLIVEMARKLFEMRHGKWLGPPENWST